MRVPESGWYAHTEWDVVADQMRVFLTYGGYGEGKRYIAHFNHHGEITMTAMDRGTVPQPTFQGQDTHGMIQALIEGAKRGGFIPNTERELSAELAGVKGELGYAKSITDRLLNHILKPTGED